MQVNRVSELERKLEDEKAKNVSIYYNILLHLS